MPMVIEITNSGNRPDQSVASPIAKFGSRLQFHQRLSSYPSPKKLPSFSLVAHPHDSPAAPLPPPLPAGGAGGVGGRRSGDHGLDRPAAPAPAGANPASTNPAAPANRRPRQGGTAGSSGEAVGAEFAQQ